MPQPYRNLADIIRMMGAKCVVCGEDDIVVLQIDHINGDAGEERALLGDFERRSSRGCTGYAQHDRAIRKFGWKYFMESRQVLCANDHVRKTVEDRKKHGHRWNGNGESPMINLDQLDMFDGNGKRD